MTPTRKTYDFVAAIWAGLYVTMLLAVHVAWLVSWQLQHARPHYGGSSEPFENWERFVTPHLALFYGSPVAAFVALTGLVISRLRERRTVWFASALLGSAVLYVTDPFGALDWWYD